MTITTSVRPVTVFQAWTGTDAEKFGVYLADRPGPIATFATEAEARAVARTFGPLGDEPTDAPETEA